MSFGKNKDAGKSYGIIGLGRFGTALAIELANHNREILVIDADEERIRCLRDYTENAFVVHSLDKETLRETGIQNCDVAVVCIGERMDVSILTTLYLKGLGIERVVAKATSAPHGEILEKLGTVPLPPYIKEKLDDPQRYQTVYAKVDGSAAAPTAGLHFTPELFETLRTRGVQIEEITLHVGLGTFRPMDTEDVQEHHMHSEWFMMDRQTAQRLNEARAQGRRIIAVGTTSCRTLEAIMSRYGQFQECHEETDIFIYPGYQFKAIDALITNFHLPKSTLSMLVSAFAGRQAVLNAYRTGVQQRYRFFSFGDAMFIE